MKTIDSPRPRSARLAALACGLLAVVASAQAPQPAPTPAAAPPTAAPAPANWTKATTVFVNTVLGSRTGGSARRLNESHAEMEAKGWRFLDLDTYSENGDLVGFFVTYVK